MLFSKVPEKFRKAILDEMFEEDCFFEASSSERQFDNKIASPHLFQQSLSSFLALPKNKAILMRLESLISQVKIGSK